MKVAKNTQKKIIADRKNGMMQGVLSWKYDVDLPTILKITKGIKTKLPKNEDNIH